MITLNVDGRYFQVEFRHQRREVGKLAGALPPFTEAITTCVVAAFKTNEEFAFTAIGTAWCWDLDNFSRRTGRLKSFRNAVTQCGALRGATIALLAAYMEYDPDPPPPPKPVPLTDEEKRARWEAGWEKRIARTSGILSAEQIPEIEKGGAA